MRKIYFKSNLKHLIKMHKDSNLELALYLGFSSDSTISNWFNKKDNFYPQDSLIIDKICLRYVIDKDSLLYEDLSSIKMPTLFELPDDKLIELQSFVFPLIIPKENDSDFFKLGFYKHKKLLQQTKVSAENMQLFNEYSNLYEKAYEIDASLPALANTLSSIIYYRAGIVNTNKIVGFYKYKNKQISNKSFYRDYILSSHEVELNSDSLTQNELNELDKSIIEIIIELKKHIEFQQFADFYLAIRYKLNIADKDLNKVTSDVIFESLLYDLVRLKNIYAINFLKYFNEISQIT